MRINIGCGTSPTPGWLNLDNSPTLTLSKLPFVNSIAVRLGLFNEAQIKYLEWLQKNKIGFVNATRLPFEPESVDVVYSCHMLEHLSKRQARIFLQEAYRVLKTSGVIRTVVPDLNFLVANYNKSGDASAFMNALHVTAPELSSIQNKLQLLIGGYRHHQWMYDAESLTQLLKELGFENIHTFEPGQTMIDDPGELNLAERQEGSLYIEATR